MAERLYQHRFEAWGDCLEFTTPKDVTPATLARLDKLGYGRDITPQISFKSTSELGRYIREVANPYAVNSPAKAAEYLQQNVFTPFEKCKQEELWVLCLNTKTRITYDAMIYRGNVNSTIVRMAEIFSIPIITYSPAIILSHNHPSGEPEPSPEDVQINRVVNHAGQLLGIELLDHLIIGNNRWVSMKERGVGFDDLK
jgi:DNA repair protein RadC